MLRTSIVLALVAVVLAGCSTTGSTSKSADKFTGDKRQVATTIDDFESAAKKGDEDKICAAYLSKALVSQFAAHGGTCQKAVHAALKDTDSFDMTVQQVDIAGLDAKVRVKSDRGKKDIMQSLTLLKEGGGWHIAGFAGR